MIKIIYEGKPYYYGTTGHQAYTATAEILMDEDASFSDVLEGLLKISEYATFPKQSRQSLKNIIDDLDYDFAENKESEWND